MEWCAGGSGRVCGGGGRGGRGRVGGGGGGAGGGSARSWRALKREVTAAAPASISRRRGRVKRRESTMSLKMWSRTWTLKEGVRGGGREWPRRAATISTPSREERRGKETMFVGGMGVVGGGGGGGGDGEGGGRSEGYGCGMAGEVGEGGGEGERGECRFGVMGQRNVMEGKEGWRCLRVSIDGRYCALRADFGGGVDLSVNWIIK